VIDIRYAFPTLAAPHATGLEELGDLHHSSVTGECVKGVQRDVARTELMTSMKSPLEREALEYLILK
jgi:hypothetical protein